MKTMQSQKEIYNGLINRLESIYKSRDINGKKCFLRSDCSLFAVDYIGSFASAVVEYADNFTDAELNRFEDGDLFSIVDQDEEKLFQSIIREIEEQKKPPQD